MTRSGWSTLLAMSAGLLLTSPIANAQQALSTCLARHRVAVTVGESFSPLPGSRAADHTLTLRGMLSGNLKSFGAAVVPVSVRPTTFGGLEGLSKSVDEAEARGATLLVAMTLDATEQKLISAYLNGDQYPLRTVRLQVNAWVVEPKEGDVLAQFALNRSYAANSTDDAVSELTANDLADPLAKALRLACDSATAANRSDEQRQPRPQPTEPWQIFQATPSPQAMNVALAPLPRDTAPAQNIQPNGTVADAPKQPTVTTLATANTADERRVALVIGNNSYQYVPKLDNAVRDALSIKQELEARGFNVEYRQDATRRAMNDAISTFVSKLSSDAIALIYYSGHGVQINSANFLLPTDLVAERESQVADDSINLGTVLEQVSRSGAKFTLAVIDACRNNPFRSNGRSLGGNKGLAPPISTADGIMVVYSAGANQEALDRVSDQDRDPNGLFTRELLKAMREPGLDVQNVVSRVRLAVIDKSKSVGHQQTPAVYDQSTGTFMFTPPAPQ